MALGTGSVQERFDNPKALLGERLRGIYLFLAAHGEAIFPHDYFADCYKDSVRGRPTIPARLVATVMVLQAQEGLTAKRVTVWNETWPGRQLVVSTLPMRPSIPRTRLPIRS